ncbi:MAG: energy transducer TonB [Bacteroidota bacterium]
MKFKHFANLALLFICINFTSALQAQSQPANQPFGWLKTSDSWYTPSSYTFKYESGDFTAKGNTVSHGPVCSNGCRETTGPGACTATMIKSKFSEAELPDGVRIPAGYSGVEYVTFDVHANGRIFGYKVVKQSVICPPCIQTAVNLVAGLDEWYPAKQDGIAVKSTVVVPVYFK